MAADILHAENKLSSLVDTSEKDDPLASMKTAVNLISIAKDIRSTDDEPASNLTQIASEIRANEPHAANLIDITGDILKAVTKLNIATELDDTSDEEELLNNRGGDPRTSLNAAVSLLSAIQSNHDDDAEKPASNLINIAEEVRSNEAPPNLVGIASAILGFQEKADSASNLINIADEIRENEKPANLINIASLIMNKHEDPVEELASYLKHRHHLRTLIEANGVSEEDKLNFISVVIQALVESRVEPLFPLPWLLIYSSALHSLNADSSIKATFNRWIWASLSDLKNNAHELSTIPPPVIIQLTRDVSASGSEHDHKKVIYFSRLFKTETKRL